MQQFVDFANKLETAGGLTPEERKNIETELKQKLLKSAEEKKFGFKEEFSWLRGDRDKGVSFSDDIGVSHKEMLADLQTSSAFARLTAKREAKPSLTEKLRLINQALFDPRCSEQNRNKRICAQNCNFDWDGLAKQYDVGLEVIAENISEQLKEVSGELQGTTSFNRKKELGKKLHKLQTMQRSLGETIVSHVVGGVKLEDVFEVSKTLSDNVLVKLVDGQTRFEIDDAIQKKVAQAIDLKKMSSEDMFDVVVNCKDRDTLLRILREVKDEVTRSRIHTVLAKDFHYSATSINDLRRPEYINKLSVDDLKLLFPKSILNRALRESVGEPDDSGKRLSEDAVRKLIKAGADVSEVDPVTQCSPLLKACMLNDAEMVRIMSDATNARFANQVDAKGNSALHYCARFGSSETLSELMKTPSYYKMLTDQNEDGLTPLQLAIEYKGFNEFYEKIPQKYRGITHRPIEGNALWVTAKCSEEKSSSIRSLIRQPVRFLKGIIEKVGSQLSSQERKRAKFYSELSGNNKDGFKLEELTEFESEVPEVIA
ncbi:hypothetical protein SOPP22_15365 [Shewanella sp. OPT22]|nr:hypothetical protein SOPP22_15365 [Shewanella sp. OPT22]